jgi:uncharacterized protein YciI
MTTRTVRIAWLLLMLVAAGMTTRASTPARETIDVQEQQPARLFAVRYRPGSAWNKDKPPGEQTGFSAHSANLQRLRREGALVLGGRFADVGLVVVKAADATAARALFATDPTIAADVFTIQIDPWSTIFAGCADERR